MEQNGLIEQNKPLEEEETIEFSRMNSEDELEQIISLMENQDICISREEIDYCQHVRIKLGNRLVYAGMLFYKLIYQITGDEEAKKMWLEFKDVIEKDEQEKKII